MNRTEETVPVQIHYWVLWSSPVFPASQSRRSVGCPAGGRASHPHAGSPQTETHSPGWRTGEPANHRGKRTDQMEPQRIKMMTHNPTLFCHIRPGSHMYLMYRWFALYTWMDRQLSLGYFDTEEVMLPKQVLEFLFSMISRQIHGRLFAMGECKSHWTNQNYNLTVEYLYAPVKLQFTDSYCLETSSLGQ